MYKYDDVRTEDPLKSKKGHDCKKKTRTRMLISLYRVIRRVWFRTGTSRSPEASKPSMDRFHSF